MNMDYSYLTTMYEKESNIHIIVMSQEAGKVTYHTYVSSNMLNNIFFYQKCIHLGGNIFIHFSQIT